MRKTTQNLPLSPRWKAISEFILSVRILELNHIVFNYTTCFLLLELLPFTVIGISFCLWYSGRHGGFVSFKDVHEMQNSQDSNLGKRSQDSWESLPRNMITSMWQHA